MTPSQKNPARTEKKEAGGKLEQFEKRILDTSSIGVLITRINDGTILYTNQAIAGLLGLPNTDEIIGKPVPNLYWDAKERETVLGKFRSEGSIKNYDLRARRADDSMIWVSISIQPFDYEGEQVLLSEITDISIRKQAERELLLRDRALASSLNGVVILNIQDNKPIYVNDAALKMTGYTREEILQLGLPDITGNPADPQKIRTAIQTQGFFIGEELIKRKDGSVFPANFFSSLITDEKGQPFAVQSNFFDITERKQAEDALRENRSLYQSLVEVSPLSVCRKDIDGRFTFANQRFLELSHTTLDDLVGKTDFDLHPSELAEKYRRDDLAIMESGQAKEIIEERVVQEGRISIVQTVKAPVYDGDGKINGIQISFWDITDRKQAEDALRESEERFRRFTEATIEGLVFHEQGTIVDANPAALTMFGLSENENLVGRNLMEFVSPESRQLALQQMQLETVSPYEIQCVRVDGSVFPVETSTRTYKVGEHVIRASAVRDISVRKKAEEELKRNINFTNALLDAIPTPVFYKDKEGRYQGCNRAFSEVMGATTEQVRGKTVHQLWPSENADVYHQKDLELMNNPQHQVYEATTKDKNGNVRPVIFAKDVFYDEGGNVAGLVGAFLDITERKQAEESLRTSEERYQTIFNSSPVMFWLKDTENNMIQINRAAAAFENVKAEDMAGRSSYDVYPREQAEAFYQDDLQVIRTGKPKLGIVEKHTSPGTGQTTWLETGKVPIRNNMGEITGVLAFAVDITEREKAAEELRRIQTTVETAPDFIAMATPDGTGVYINPAGLEMIGYTSEEFYAGMKISAVQPDIPPQVFETVMREGIWRGESELVRKDGSCFPISQAISAYKDKQGQVQQIITIARDITEQRRAEKALAESEAQFRSLFDQSADAVLLLENGLFTDCNQATVQMMRAADKTQFLSLHPSKLSPEYQPDGRPSGEKADEMIRIAMEKGSHRFEWIHLRVDGSEVPVEVLLTPIVMGDRTVVHTVWRDITERKQAEEVTRSTREMLFNIIDFLPDATFVTDRERKVIAWNRAIEEMTGVKKEDIIGKGDFAYAVPFYGEARPMLVDFALGTTKVADRYEAIQKEGNKLSAEIYVPAIYQGRGGNLLVTTSPLYTPDGNMVGAVETLRDITERKRLEAQIQEAFERRGYQVQVSTEISQEVASAPKLDELLERVVTLTKERLGYYHTQLLRYDPSEDAVVLVNGYGEVGQKMLESEHKMPMGSGLIGTAAATGETIMRPTLADDLTWQPNPLLPDTKGEIAVPIKWQDTVLGVLDVQSNQAGALTEDDRLLLEGLCGQIAIAMHSAELVETIRRNEARLGEALRIARLGNWEYDFENDLFHFTDDFYAIFRTTAEKVGGYKISSADYAKYFVHPDDAPLVGNEIQKVLDAKDRLFTTHLEHRIIFSDGKVGHIAVNINVERDESGRITRWYGANQDITERKLAEAGLAEALKAARLANWEYDVEKDIFTFNDQFYSIFHTTAEKVGGYQLSSAQYATLFVHPDDMEVVGMEIGKALSSTERVYNTSIDHRILYADGGVGYITVKLTVERDENGKITRYYGANQDITEQRKAQEELAERLEEINRLYQNLSHEGWKSYRATADLPSGFIFDQTGVKPVEEAALNTENYTSIPMKVLGGEIVGNLAVVNDPQHPMSLEDLTFLQQVSDQIALALEGARLAAQTQASLAETEELYQASAELSTALSYDDILNSIRKNTICREAQNISLNAFDRPWTQEREPEWIDALARWSILPSEAVMNRYALSSFPSAHTLLHPDTPTILEDIENAPNMDDNARALYTQRFGAKSTIFVPLVVSGQWIGYINAIYQQRTPFPESEVRRLSTMAGQAAVIVNNLRLLGETQRQAEREGMLNIISQKIQSATTVEDVLQIAARELGHALGAPMTIAKLNLKGK